MVSLIVFLVVLSFYLYTLQPSLAWGDGTRIQREAITGESFIQSEMQNVAFAADTLPFPRLGVAAWDHPLYVIVTHTAVRLLAHTNPLWLVNVHSAVFGAATIAVLFRLCYAHTRSLLASMAASFSLAVSHTFWFHSVTPEVYTLFAFLLLLSLYLYDLYERTGQTTALAASMLALGLGMSNHLLAGLAVPALAIYQWSSGKPWPAVAFPPRRWVAGGLAFLVGWSPYAIQFVRMLRTFPLAQILGPVAGTNFLGAALAPNPLLVARSVLTYLLFLALQFGLVGVLIGLYGWWVGALAYRPLWRKTVALYGVYTVFGILYRVSDQFAFFLGSHVFWALAIGMGAARLGARLPTGKRTAFFAIIGLTIAGMPLFYRVLPGIARAMGFTDDTLGIPQIGTGFRDGLAYFANPDKRGDYSPYNFGRETLTGLPADAVVMAEYYTDTEEYFVLRYFSVVEHLRTDVEIVGWPSENPFRFDSSHAVKEIERDLPNRPVFLASLSDEYYRAATLVKKYCIVPEDNLYRVYPGSLETNRATGLPCATAAQP